MLLLILRWTSLKNVFLTFVCFTCQILMLDAMKCWKHLTELTSVVQNSIFVFLSIMASVAWRFCKYFSIPAYCVLVPSYLFKVLKSMINCALIVIKAGQFIDSLRTYTADLSYILDEAHSPKICWITNEQKEIVLIKSPIFYLQVYPCSHLIRFQVGIVIIPLCLEDQMVWINDHVRTVHSINGDDNVNAKDGFWCLMASAWRATITEILMASAAFIPEITFTAVNLRFVWSFQISSSREWRFKQLHSDLDEPVLISAL